jgi:hypothetical protein
MKRRVAAGVWWIAGAVAAALGLAGCGAGADPNELVHKVSARPRFMKYQDRMKQRAEEMHGAPYREHSMFDDKLGSGTQFTAGDEPLFDELLLNEGPASSGLKVTVTGSALSQLIDLKRPLEVWSFEKLNGRVVAHQRAPFVHSAENTYVAIVQDFPYRDVVEVAFRASTWKFAGTGGLRIEVQPLAGDTPTVWAHDVSVSKRTLH